MSSWNEQVRQDKAREYWDKVRLKDEIKMKYGYDVKFEDD